MIVNSIENGWEIIYHRAHALLAAQIAGHWLGTDRPTRWIETIATVSHHDDLEKEWEGNHLNAAGAPRDFMQEEFSPKSIESFNKTIEESLYRGRWVALLTSMHVSFLSAPLREQVPEVDQFLKEQLEKQKAWRRELKVKKEDAEKAYAFMQWCDRLSLILCQQDLPSRQRALEISKGPDGTRYDIMQREDQTINVTPWPFGLEKFTVNVEAIHLSQLKFEGNAELVEALKTAPIKELVWEFVK